MQFGSNAINENLHKTLPRIFIEWVEKIPRSTKNSTFMETSFLYLTIRAHMKEAPAEIDVFL